MSKSETPISDAVTEAQEKNGTVSWDVTMTENDDRHDHHDGYLLLQAQGGNWGCGVRFRQYDRLNKARTAWSNGTNADAAAALRLVADALSPAGGAVSDSLQRVNASVEGYAADLRTEFGDSQYHIHWGAVFSRIGDIISQAEDDDKREKLSPDREKRALEIMTRAFHVATQIISDEADTGLEKLRGELLEQAEEETPDAPDK